MIDPEHLPGLICLKREEENKKEPFVSNSRNFFKEWSQGRSHSTDRSHACWVAEVVFPPGGCSKELVSVCL